MQDDVLIFMIYAEKIIWFSASQGHYMSWLFFYIECMNEYKDTSDSLRMLISEAVKGDRKAEETLLEAFTPMLRSVAAEYLDAAEGREEMDDLMQIASMGFILALRRFDPDISPAFIPYVRYGARMAIRDHLCSSMRLIRLPKGMVERVSKLSHAYRTLEEEGNEHPSEEDLMAMTGFSRTVLARTERARRMQLPMSLDHEYGDGSSASSFIPSAECVEEEAEAVLMEDRLRGIVSRLSCIDRFVISAYYGAFGSRKLGSGEIARRLSVSGEAVRKRTKRIEERLCRMIS